MKERKWDDCQKEKKVSKERMAKQLDEGMDWGAVENQKAGKIERKVKKLKQEQNGEEFWKGTKGTTLKIGKRAIFYGKDQR